MRHPLASLLLSAAFLNVAVGSSHAAIILPFSGEGTVSAGPCSADQVDPAACFTLSETSERYVLNGEPGYRFEFSGMLVPNPDPAAFPFPTYVGAGMFSLTRGMDGLSGTWQNLFVPGAPPAGCNVMAPFGDPNCWTAQSSAFFDYAVSGGTGIYTGLIGTGDARVDVVTGFPPGNVDPATGSPFTERGVFELRPVPEPGALALLGTGLLGVLASAKRRCRRQPRASRQHDAGNAS